MNRIAVLVLPSTILLTACDTFSVYRDADPDDPPFFGNEDEIPGIPFFSRKAMIEQTTIHVREWIDLKVNLKKSDADAKDKGVDLSWRLSLDQINRSTLIALIDSSRTAKSVAEFQASIDSNLSPCSKGRSENCKISEGEFKEALQPFEQDDSPLSERMIANDSEYTSFIDYGSRHYIMPEYPFFGSNASEIILNDDGTLGTAKGNVDASKIADLIPLKEYLTKKWGLTAPATSTDESTKTDDPAKGQQGLFGVAPGTPTRFKAVVDIAINGYSYTLTQRRNIKHNGDVEICLNISVMLDTPTHSPSDVISSITEMLRQISTILLWLFPRTRTNLGKHRYQ